MGNCGNPAESIQLRHLTAMLRCGGSSPHPAGRGSSRLRWVVGGNTYRCATKTK
jgi:hypothetical protein